MDNSKPNYANEHMDFANVSPLQFTLREMRETFSNSKFWIGFAAVVVILVVSGPFYTAINLNLAERVSYWLLISGLSFVTGLFISLFLGVWLHERGLNRLVSQSVAGMVAGVPIAGIVWLAGVYVFDFDPGKTTEQAVTLFAQCMVISAIVALLFSLVRGGDKEKIEQAVIVPSSTSFFKRLPVEIGEDLISLQAQDHYLKVTTTKGSEMLLMRMADACQELSDFDGMQVHRSWWVASNHVRSLKKASGKGILTLSDGQEVSVSRGFLKEAVERLQTP